jgi:hypothetical protein
VAYLRWLLGERQLQPVSVLNHMSAAASEHKFLQRYEAFPNRNYEDVAAICSVRQWRRQIQRMVQRFQPPPHFGGVGSNATVVAVGASGAGV